MEPKGMIMLDDFYALEVKRCGGNEVSGEVVRLAAKDGQDNTRLFGVPLMQDEQSAKEWAIRALQAYREG